jgi:hypothetical protein
MPVNIPRGKIDPVVEEIKNALAVYESDHPNAKIDLYRQNSASIRVRIIDPFFAKMSRRERNDYVWRYFDNISEDAQGEISMLIPLAPSEVKKDFANLEFDDPVPSML